MSTRDVDRDLENEIDQLESALRVARSKSKCESHGPIVLGTLRQHQSDSGITLYKSPLHQIYIRSYTT